MMARAARSQNDLQNWITITFMFLDVEPVKSRVLYLSSQDNPAKLRSQKGLFTQYFVVFWLC
jgi:hypothetical protein